MFGDLLLNIFAPKFSSALCKADLQKQTVCVSQSLLLKAEYLVWMDACIRWKDSVSLENLFERSRQRGIQCINDTGSIAVRTVQSMFDFYGDQPCQYSPFAELLSGFELFYNDRWVVFPLL